MKNAKTNKARFVLALMLMVSVIGFGLTGCATNASQTAGAGTDSNSTQNTAADNSQAASANPSSSTADTDGDGIPDDVEKTYGTNPYTADTDGDGVNDKDDKEPVKGQNLIRETSASPLDVTIKDVRVEDNAEADHLEITMTNTGKTDLSNFDIYYTITDKADQTQESYYQKLNGLTLAAGETKTIHFDNQISEAGHYYMNMNGLYGTSSNGLTFEIQLHAEGYQPLKFNVEKATGTAEVAD